MTMNLHDIELYGAAAVVVGAGLQFLPGLGPHRPARDGGAGAGGSFQRGASSNGGSVRGGFAPVVGATRAAWARRPWATAVTLAAVVLGIVLQYTVTGFSAHFEREPGALSDGQWWRVLTALFIQSSGAVQIVVNVGSLLVAGAIAEWVLGPWRWLAVFFLAGSAANYVSLEGWSRHGGGSSVAICGLVGALAALVALRGLTGRVAGGPPIRLIALLIPVAGVFLCAIHNNHGVGLVTGFVLGLVLSVTARPGALRLGGSAPAPRSAAAPDMVEMRR